MVDRDVANADLEREGMRGGGRERAGKLEMFRPNLGSFDFRKCGGEGSLVGFKSP